MRDRIAQPCHTFQAQRQPVAFHRDSIPAAYRTVAQRRFCVVSAVTLAARSRRRPATARPTAAAPEEHSKKTLHYSYRRLKSFGEHHCKLNRPCGRRTRVIHNPGVLCTVIHLSLIHISEPTRPLYISYAVFCLKKKTETVENSVTVRLSLIHI